MDGNLVLLPLMLATAGIFGIAFPILTDLRKNLGDPLSLTETQWTALGSTFHVVYLPMLLLTGMGIDAWGVKHVLFLSCLLSALGIFSFSKRGPFALDLAAAIMAGAGIAGLGTCAFVLMPAALWTKQAAASLNLGYVVVTLGILAGPRLTSLLFRKLDFQKALAALALLCLVPALMAALIELPGAAAGSRWQALLHEGSFWLVGLVVFLYPALEMAVCTWTVPYLTEQHGWRVPRARAWLAGFWLCLLGSRVVMAGILACHPLHGPDQPWTFLGLGLLAAVLFGHLAGSANPTRAVFGLLLLGCTLGPILPTLMGLVFRSMPTETGTAAGALTSVAFMGSLLLAPLIDTYTRRHSIRHAWGLMAIVSLVIVLGCLVLAVNGGLPKME